MQAMVRRDEPDAAAPTHVRSRDHHVWTRSPSDQNKWVLDDKPPSDLVPFKTRLSATRMRWSYSVMPGRIQFTFDEMDGLVSITRNDLLLINRVVDSEDMRAIKEKDRPVNTPTAVNGKHNGSRPGLRRTPRQKK